MRSQITSGNSFYILHFAVIREEFLIETNAKTWYSIDTKRKQPPTKWLTSKNSYISLPVPPSDKVGLFIFACCSYLCRQAVQQETFRKELTVLKLRMYPYTPPPLFFKFREATTLQHDCFSLIFYHIIFLVTILF